MDAPEIDRKYNLTIDEDRNDFFEKYSTNIRDIVSKDDFFEILDFLGDEFGEEWITVYPHVDVSIHVNDKRSKSIDFYKRLLPFGVNFLSLKELQGFDILIQKMKVPKQRESTILEINSAACYKKAGYEVVLEPRAEKGKYSDFKVKYGDEWIFFECKMENQEASEYFQSYQRIIEEIVDKVEDIVKTEMGEEYRLDIVLKKKVNSRERNNLISSINKMINEKRYQQWIKTEPYEIAVNLRVDYVDYSPLRIKFGMITVSNEPTRVSDENMFLRIFYDPFGKGEIRKIQRILKDAKKTDSF